MDFTHFDQRHYPTVPVQDGYGEWALQYDESVQDEMDLRLFARLDMNWGAVNRALDLACGTGRIGAWLKGQGVTTVEGVDFTPEMVNKAREKGVYSALHIADITDTRLPAQSYDLLTQSLADEHLPDLNPLYREAARLATPGGHFVLVGIHPFYFMAGNATHYHRADGEAVTVKTYVHLLSDHIKAAHAAGWQLVTMDEGVIDAEWLAVKPKWQKLANQPVSFLMMFRRG